VSSWVTAEADKRRFLLITFVDAVGTGAFSAAGVVLFSRLLHLGSSSIASGLAVASLAAAALLVPVSRLVEGRSLGWTMVNLNVGLAVLVPVLLLRGGVVPFAAVMGAIVLLERALSAVRGAALGRMSTDRLAARARARIAANVGLPLGGAAAAAAIAVGSHTALVLLLLIDAVSFLACAALSTPFKDDRQPRAGSTPLACIGHRRPLCVRVRAEHVRVPTQQPVVRRPCRSGSFAISLTASTWCRLWR
jgi:hypothetical protein